jgi:RNA polymerase sigma factor (sigma-70 family)
MEHHDQLYIDRILKGDHRAFAFLVDKYKYMAYTIALKIMNNEADAEDVAQESFVKAYRQLHTFEGKSKFSTWLHTIVYRTAVSKLQENKNTLDTSPITDEVAENHPSDQSSFSIERLEAADRQRYVWEAVQKLPKLEALVIMLYYLGEHSIKEIQEITGLTAENIKIKLFRARKKLEQRLRFLM